MDDGRVSSLREQQQHGDQLIRDTLLRATRRTVAIVDATASILDVVDGTITTDTVCIRAVTDEPAGP
jgi:hypothetical protein